MMMTAPNAVEQKRDLHVGGIGSRAGGALAAITHPLEARDAGIDRDWDARASLEGATAAVRDNPWTALALVSAVGLAAGYLLGRR